MAGTEMDNELYKVNGFFRVLDTKTIDPKSIFPKDRRGNFAVLIEIDGLGQNWGYGVNQEMAQEDALTKYMGMDILIHEYLFSRIDEKGNLILWLHPSVKEDCPKEEFSKEFEEYLFEGNVGCGIQYSTGEHVFIGLTEAPFFADFSYSDNGDVEFPENGTIYYYDEYMINNWIDELYNGNSVTFTKHEY